MKEMPNLPSAPCACWDPQDQAEIGCVCGDSERVLRHIVRTHGKLSDDQREWCLREIDQVEGHSRADFKLCDDATIAAGVMSAWVDYARDKGLL